MNAAKLKHVLAIDLQGSITAAARTLNLTQSTVSRSLADIEADVGYALFERRARDVVATERGREFINRAARIISDLDQLSEDARIAREASESLIRVGVSPASMQGLLNQAIRRLVVSTPETRLHFEAFSGNSGAQALQRGDIDILVGPEEALKIESSFVYELLGELRTRLFVRIGHPLAGANRISPARLSQYPVVAPDKMSWHTEQLRKLFTKSGGDSARRMHVVEYFPLVADIVAGSDSIGVISEEYAESASFTARFSLLDISYFTPLRIGFATRRRWLPSPAMRAFQSALREHPPATPVGLHT